MENELKNIYTLFFDGTPVIARSIDTSRGDADFRMTFIIEIDSGEKRVLKLADNDFTFPDKILVWQRTVDEYRRLGYYCPRIFSDKSGVFPFVNYHGHHCVAYAEEYSMYQSAEDRNQHADLNGALYDGYNREIWRMTAQVAAKHFDYTEFPSAYCLFETFCPSDSTDEVLENALKWKEYAYALPAEFKNQVEKIWRLWTNNRAKLEKIYKTLPASVFQADLNPSNILVDGDGKFAGVCDFNLCGRDVFLNYLMRENNDVQEICEALKISAEYYRFSEIEKEAAPMMYRCLKPLWYSSVEKIRDSVNDYRSAKKHLDETERELTRKIDFRKYME